MGVFVRENSLFFSFLLSLSISWVICEGATIYESWQATWHRVRILIQSWLDKCLHAHQRLSLAAGGDVKHNDVARVCVRARSWLQGSHDTPEATYKDTDLDQNMNKIWSKRTHAHTQQNLIQAGMITSLLSNSITCPWSPDNHFKRPQTR